MRNSQSLSYQSLVKCSPLHIDGERAEWRGRVAHSCYITIGGGGGRRIHISVRVRPAPKSTLPLGRAARSSLAASPSLSSRLSPLPVGSVCLCIAKLRGGQQREEKEEEEEYRSGRKGHSILCIQRNAPTSPTCEKNKPGPSTRASEQARSEEGGRQSGRRREDEEEQEQEGASERG